MHWRHTFEERLGHLLSNSTPLPRCSLYYHWVAVNPRKSFAGTIPASHESSPRHKF